MSKCLRPVHTDVRVQESVGCILKSPPIPLNTMSQKIVSWTAQPSVTPLPNDRPKTKFIFICVIHPLHWLQVFSFLVKPNDSNCQSCHFSFSFWLCVGAFRYLALPSDNRPLVSTPLVSQWRCFYLIGVISHNLLCFDSNTPNTLSIAVITTCVITIDERQARCCFGSTQTSQ